MIETEQLVQLAAFARYGTLSKAAEALHISQPSLSRTMQALEGELQASLFVRRKNRLALTEAGELAVRYAEKITAELDEMGRQVRALDRANRCVSIGVCAQVPGHDLTVAFAQADSGAAVACQMESDDAALWEGLRKGEYQIIVVHTRPPEDEELFWFAYRDEKLSLLVPKDHPLAHHTELTRADLEHQNLLLYREIGFWYELSRQNLPSAHFLYTNEWDAFGELAGLGFPGLCDQCVRCLSVAGEQRAPPGRGDPAHPGRGVLCRLLPCLPGGGQAPLPKADRGAAGRFQGAGILNPLTSPVPAASGWRGPRPIRSCRGGSTRRPCRRCRRRQRP